MSSFVYIFFEVSFNCENRRVVQVRTHQMVQKIKNRNQISDITFLYNQDFFVHMLEKTLGICRKN